MKNGIKGKQSIPAVITIEFRVTKRNQSIIIYIYISGRFDIRKLNIERII